MPDDRPDVKLSAAERVCPRCGKKVRLVRREADKRFNNLDVVTFACDCGEDAGRFVARDDGRNV